LKIILKTFYKFPAGIGLTVITGGMAAIIAGAAIAGSGTSLVFSPIQKYMSKECVTLKESAKDVAIGATIGGVTGPIGAIGSIASRGASAAVQIGARIAAGSSAGAVTGILSEGAKAMQGEEVTLKSVTHSAFVGAAVGTIGGASSQIARGVTKPLTNEIGRAVTRIAVQGSSSAVTDAGVQLVQSGTVNPQQLILNTTGKMALATTAEVSTSVTKQIEVKIADSHNKKHEISTKSHSDKDASTKEVQALNKQETDTDLHENIKPQNVNQQGCQLDQNPVTSETFDQKIMGAVNSTGMVFNEMFSGISSQLKSSYDRFTGLKSQLNRNDDNEEELEKKEIQMNEILSKDAHRDIKEGMSNDNESTDLSDTDSSLSHRNDCLNNSSSTDIVQSDESVPLLIKINYDLLLEAQNSDHDLASDKSDLLYPIKCSDDEQTTEISHNSASSLKDETLESPLEQLPESNEMDKGLEQLSSLVSKVIASMDVEAPVTKKESSDESLSTNNNDSHTRDKNLEDKEVVYKSFVSSICKQNDLIDFTEADETVTEHLEVISSMSEEQQLIPEDETHSDHERSSTDAVDSKATNEENSLRHRAMAISKYEGTSEIKYLKKKTELDTDGCCFPSIYMSDTHLILTVIAILIIWIVLSNQSQ